MHLINGRERHLLLMAGCIAVAPDVRERRQVLHGDGVTVEIELPDDVLNQSVPIVGYNVLMPYRICR